MPIHLPPDFDSGAFASGPRMSRRDLLGAGALLAFAGCSSRAGSKGNPGGWFAWLSDLHIGPSRDAARFGQVMAANVREVVADILAADDPPRGVIVAGDLALDDGRPDDYRQVLQALGPLCQAGIPQHLILGNHDDRDHFRAALLDEASESAIDDKHVGIVEAPDIRFVLLDSLIKPNQTAGALGARQRAWLADRLDERPRTTTLIVVHHHLDARRRSALNDTTALLDVIGPRRQVKAVLFGHTHVGSVLQQPDGLWLINLPAIGYKLKRHGPLGWCAFRPRCDGAEIEQRHIGRDRRKHGVLGRSLTWRSI